MEIRVANIRIVAADTEYGWALPKDCMWFTLHEREGREFRLATEPGHVANSEPPYYTMLANEILKQRNLDIRVRQPFYFACEHNERIVEVLMGIKEEGDAGE